MSFKTKKNLELHLLCKRHSERTKKEKPTYPFVCDCGKKYCHRQSLYTHKMKCDGVKETEPKQNDAIPLVEKEQPEKMKQVYVTVEEMQEIIKLYKIEHQKMKAEIAVLTAAVNKREPETNKREPAHEPEITHETETTTTKRKKISKRVRQRIADKQKHKCGECEQVLPPFFHLDHIVGLQFDGTDEESNLMALCYECHTKKNICENQSRKQIRDAIQNILRENQKNIKP
jgi:5-methylcytosine-specific restriction endonuclease McrA